MHGLGASDMKGGLAVMIELGRWAADTELAYDLALLFFPREELGPAENPLPGVFGYHELFHAFVIVAVGLQYAAIAFYVLPGR